MILPSRLRAGTTFLAPAAVLAAVTLPHLHQGDLRSDAAWYAAIALQAWRTGEFWTLHAYPGQPYFNKPPLGFWIHGGVLHALGPGVLTARLPSVAAALGCVLLTAAIVRELASRRAALLAGLATATSLEFFRRVREISLDMWQLLFMLAALCLAASAVRRQQPARLIWAGVPLGLALLCKPLTALLAVPLLALWLAWVGQTRMTWHLLGGCGVAVFLAAPWHVSMLATHGREFLDQYLGVEVIDRAAGRRADSLGSFTSPWFYLARLATRSWPWIACAGLAAAWLVRGRALSWRNLAPKLALVWTAGWLVALSAFPDRRDRYGLPLHAGVGMLAGLWLAQAPWTWVQRGRDLWARWAAPVLVPGAILVSLLPVRFHRPPETHWPELFEWIRREGVADNLWQGGFGGPRGARVYLELGHWPAPTHDARGRRIADPPPGAVLLYHRRDGLHPGDGEQILWRSRDGVLTATRLHASAWHPQPAPDPGQ